MAVHSARTIIFTVLVFALANPIHADDATALTPASSSSNSSNAACDFTPHPDFCRTVLPDNGDLRNLQDCGRFSLALSLNEAWSFAYKVDQYIAGNSTLSPSTVGALEDCRLLAGLNVDFLLQTGATLNSTLVLPDMQAYQFQALLGATITNQDTCLEGLGVAEAPPEVMNNLSGAASWSGKLYSISLAFFSQAWMPRSRKVGMTRGFVPGNLPVPPKLNGPPNKARRLLFHELEKLNRGQGLPLRMSSPDREIYESWIGRRLLRSSRTVKVSKLVVVDKLGRGDFLTINDAVESAPNNTVARDGYYMIYAAAGVYEENVSIPKYKKYVMLVGNEMNQTIITGNRNVVDGWTTFNSATFAVVGEGFVGAFLTIRNTAGPTMHQAVALRSGADLSSFFACSFEGYQDTLYTHSLRQFYRECNIYGTVDFILGNAAVVLQDCNIYARLPIPGQQNTITAQGRTDPNQNTGTSIQNCTIVATPELSESATKTYLGRPWKLYSRTVVMESFMDSLIDPAGWLPWDGSFALDTLYYAEYSNWGPGSNTACRVAWPGYQVIDATTAANFTVSSFLSGDSWLPQTGIPYLSGLAS